MRLDLVPDRPYASVLEFRVPAPDPTPTDARGVTARAGPVRLDQLPYGLARGPKKRPWRAR